MPSRLLFFWEAFREVNTDRAVGMGPGRIPFTALSAYADRYGITGTDAFDRFRKLMRAMEAEFLATRPTEPSVDEAQGVKGILQRLAKPHESTNGNTPDDP